MSRPPGVLSFEDAYEVVRERCQQILKAGDRPSEEVLLLHAVGRVLAEPVLADRDFPPFPRATRDGFAVRADDLAHGLTLLRVVGQVRAGDSYDLPVTSGEAVEIMTGAAVPAGADAVVMVEYTERKSQEIDRKGAKERKGNLRAREVLRTTIIFWILRDMWNPRSKRKKRKTSLKYSGLSLAEKTLCRPGQKLRQGRSCYARACVWDRLRLPWGPPRERPV